MFADLHLHSIYSDGRYTPEEICRKAKARGLSLLSITDHDTLAGEEEKQAAAKKQGLLYLSGWEISAYVQGEKMHVLGYGCKRGEAYRAFMDIRENGALLRAQDRVQKLQALGIPVTMEEVFAQCSSPEAPVHTMHVARAAAKHLNISDGEVYTRYLDFNCPAYSEIGRPSPKQAIDCIHACDGLAVLAHPGRLTATGKEREKILLELIEYGADGIEVFYTTHAKEETAYFSRLATRHNLLMTGGTDTHFESDTHQIGGVEFTPAKALIDRAI